MLVGRTGQNMATISSFFSDILGTDTVVSKFDVRETAQSIMFEVTVVTPETRAPHPSIKVGLQTVIKNKDMSISGFTMSMQATEDCTSATWRIEFKKEEDRAQSPETQERDKTRVIHVPSDIRTLVKVKLEKMKPGANVMTLSYETGVNYATLQAFFDPTSRQRYQAKTLTKILGYIMRMDDAAGSREVQWLQNVLRNPSAQ